MEELKVIPVERVNKIEGREPVRRKRKKADRTGIALVISVGVNVILSIAVYILQAGPV